eukprot:9437593-Pyramimonas_sp.AAC.1
MCACSTSCRAICRALAVKTRSPAPTMKKRPPECPAASSAAASAAGELPLTKAQRRSVSCRRTVSGSGASSSWSGCSQLGCYPPQ